ncbi:twin-arginine translocation signal domain-containing protein [Halostella litorea]|uniref:twin-arginine translocation signal domain-containing protein n=1 Tax=Halostella litorea TaxID=2528831 RepID=UPI0010926B55|nr:twin-arginine translocation signal domain-containing protein [Halostella litorea]
MTDRRGFLRRVAAAGAGSALGVAALPTTPEADTELMPRDRSPSADPDDRPPSVRVEDDAPYAMWQYKATGDGYAATSPINVVFPLSSSDRGLPEVMSVLDAAGWQRTPIEYARYAWHRERETYVLQQATAAESFYGRTGRNHVRCWELEGAVSMQVHEDTPATPNHGIASYERAQRRIERLFDDAGWTVDGTVRFANEKGPDHDGHATVIRP